MYRQSSSKQLQYPFVDTKQDFITYIKLLLFTVSLNICVAGGNTDCRKLWCRGLDWVAPPILPVI